MMMSYRAHTESAPACPHRSDCPSCELFGLAADTLCVTSGLILYSRVCHAAQLAKCCRAIMRLLARATPWRLVSAPPTRACNLTTACSSVGILYASKTRRVADVAFEQPSSLPCTSRMVMHPVRVHHAGASILRRRSELSVRSRKQQLLLKTAIQPISICC